MKNPIDNDVLFSRVVHYRILLSHRRVLRPCPTRVGPPRTRPRGYVNVSPPPTQISGEFRRNRCTDRGVTLPTLGTPINPLTERCARGTPNGPRGVVDRQTPITPKSAPSRNEVSLTRLSSLLPYILDGRRTPDRTLTVSQ